MRTIADRVYDLEQDYYNLLHFVGEVLATVEVNSLRDILVVKSATNQEQANADWKQIRERWQKRLKDFPPSPDEVQVMAPVGCYVADVEVG